MAQVCTVDRDLANHNAVFAAKVEVMSGLDVRLAFIDPTAGEDKYHVLQGVKDATAGGEPSCCYLFQRWGGTGTRGQMQVDGPMLQTGVAVALAKVFAEKTGCEWGSIKPGTEALPGKYWLQQQMTPDLQAKWEYDVSDGVDGKPTGWYPYDNYASDEVEELYAQHVANACEARTATRLISSGRFTYKVDLSKMKQQNTRTETIRTIRRSFGDQSAAASRKRTSSASLAKASPALKRVTMKLAMKSAHMKAMKSMQAMKAMKVMKAAKKKVSKIGSKSQVLKGLKSKTKGGMTALDLMKNKNGKVVSKKKSARGTQAYEKNLANWTEAFLKARKELDLTGFVAIEKASELYKRTKALMISEE